MARSILPMAFIFSWGLFARVSPCLPKRQPSLAWNRAPVARQGFSWMKLREWMQWAQGLMSHEHVLRRRRQVDVWQKLPARSSTETSGVLKCAPFGLTAGAEHENDIASGCMVAALLITEARQLQPIWAIRHVIPFRKRNSTNYCFKSCRRI